MLKINNVRNFNKVGDFAPIPDLIDLQVSSYQRFLQAGVDSSKIRVGI